MRKLIFGLFTLSIFLGSCVKDEFNVEKEVAIIGSKWEGEGRLTSETDTIDINLEFLKDGLLNAKYDTSDWKGSYNFNLETNKGIITDSANIEMPFEIKVDTLKFRTLDGDQIFMYKVK